MPRNSNILQTRHTQELPIQNPTHLKDVSVLSFSFFHFDKNLSVLFTSLSKFTHFGINDTHKKTATHLNSAFSMCTDCCFNLHDFSYICMVFKNKKCCWMTKISTEQPESAVINCFRYLNLHTAYLVGIKENLTSFLGSHNQEFW